MLAIAAMVLLLLLAACAGPGDEGAAQTAPVGTPAGSAVATEVATVPVAAAAPAAALLIVSWDDVHGQVVRAVAPLTGEDLDGYAPLPFASERDDFFLPLSAVAPDGRWLAMPDVAGDVCYAYAGGETCGPRSAGLHLVDVAAWTIDHIPLAPDGWVGPLAFSADGRWLAFAVRGDAHRSELRLLDTAAGAVTATVELPFAPSQLGFGPNGTTVVVYGQAEAEDAGMDAPPPPQVMLLDTGTLATVWQTALPDVISGHWCAAQCDAGFGVMEMVSRRPAVVLSPGGERLTIAHADADRLTTVDLQRRAVTTVPIGPRLNWLERLLAATAGVAHAKGPADTQSRYAALSPDGTRLYLAGHGMTVAADGGDGLEVSETFTPLQVIDPATGEVLAESDAHAYWLQLTPDGTRLLVRDLSAARPFTAILDATTLAPVGRVDDQDLFAIRDRAGGVHYVGQSSRHRLTNFSVFDPDGFSVVGQWSAEGPAWLVTGP